MAVNGYGSGALWRGVHKSGVKAQRLLVVVGRFPVEYDQLGRLTAAHLPEVYDPETQQMTRPVTRFDNRITRAPEDDALSYVSDEAVVLQHDLPVFDLELPGERLESRDLLLSL